MKQILQTSFLENLNESIDFQRLSALNKHLLLMFNNLTTASVKIKENILRSKLKTPEDLDIPEYFIDAVLSNRLIFQKVSLLSKQIKFRLHFTSTIPIMC